MLLKLKQDRLSVILRRQFVVNISYQGYPHLGRVIAPEHVTDEVCLDLHLHHLQCAPQHAAKDIGIPQLILGASIIRELHKIGQRVFLKYERELLAVACPVGDGRRYIEEDLESHLH